jgi:hypothetical protein
MFSLQVLEELKQPTDLERDLGTEPFGGLLKGKKKMN